MTNIAAFWQEACDAVGASTSDPPPEAWAFGDSPEQADELLALVLSGTKTATSSALWEYEADGEELPRIGELSIILDGRGEPRALIETVEVEVAPMEQVDEAFAADEGEDDRTLACWWVSHEDYFSRNLPRIGREFDPAMPLVLERFRVRYPDADDTR